MKKYYLLRRDKQCIVTEKNLIVCSEIFDEVGDRIEITSKNYKKDFKNIQTGDDVICFDHQNIDLLCSATVIQNSLKKIQGIGIKSRYITLLKTCKKVSLDSINSNDRLIKFIRDGNSDIFLIEIEKNEYLKFLDK